MRTKTQKAAAKALQSKPKAVTKPEIKAMNVRLPKDIWKFLKRTSMTQEVSINSIITKLVSDYKNYREMHPVDGGF